MRHGLVVLTILLAGVSASARAQIGPVTPGASVLHARHDLPSFATRPPPPAAVKWGMVIGGVAGASVAAVLVFGHPCHGEDCSLRAAVAILPIGIGAGVGILVGGAVGNAVARESEFNDLGAAEAARLGVKLRFGLRIPLSTPH